MLTLWPRIRIVGCIALAAGCALAIWGVSHCDQAHQAALKLQAAQQASQVQAALQDRDAYRAQAEGFLADLNRLKVTASDQAGEIARLKAAHPTILQAPQGVPDPCSDLRALAVQQDGLIQTQGLQLGTWERRGAAFEMQLAASDRAVDALKVQIAGITPDRPWSAGPLVGVNAAGQLRFGVIASGAYKRIQGHALVLGDTAALGVTIRFGGGR